MDGPTIRDSKNPNWPSKYMPKQHCKPIDCNVDVACKQQKKVVMFVDLGNYHNWHVMRQQCDGMWTSKNGDRPVLNGIPSPPLYYYNIIYPPKGEVRIICWSCP